MRKKFSSVRGAERVRLGRALRQARRERGMTQGGLARVLGLNQKCISALELGTSDNNYEEVRTYLADQPEAGASPPTSRLTLEAIRPLVEAVDAAEATYRAALTRRNYDTELEFAGSDWQAAQHKLEQVCVAYVRAGLALPVPARPATQAVPLHERSGGIRAALVGACPLPPTHPALSSTRSHT